VSVIEPLSISDEAIVVIEYISYYQSSEAIVRMEQPFSASERTTVGAKS
jgi:hypothetical protein